MPKHTLSYKLKDYRKQNGMTQEELAELLNVSSKSISKWELGDGYPSKKNLETITEALDIPLESLVNEGQTGDSRLKKSFKYALASYCIIFALTLVIRAIKEGNNYPDILSRDNTEILKLVLIAFGQNIYIAIVPALIIGLVFYVYIIPRKQADE